MDPAFTRKRTTEVSPNLKIFGGPFPAEPTLAHFGGRAGRTVVGLGGSGNHFLGAAPATALAIPR